MAENKPYSPEVYKRLELVRKQFQHNAADQRKQRAAERRQRILSSLKQNRVRIARFTTFIILGLLLLAVIAVVIMGAIAK